MEYRRPVLPRLHEFRPPVHVVRSQVRAVVAAPAPRPLEASIPRPAINAASLTLSDTMLMGVAARPDVRAEFSFLRPTTPTIGKLCCGAAAAARRAYQKQLDAMKAALNNLPAERKARFKELLKIDRVAMYLGGVRIEF